MSSINSTSGLTTQALGNQALSTQALAGRAGGHRGNSLLDTAAKALGLSKEDLVSQLKSGKSLDEIAAAQGVSHNDLAAAIKAGMPPELATSSKADSLVDSILSKKGMPERPQSAPPAGSAGSAGSSSSGVLGSSLTDAQQQTLDALSSLLGTDSASLIDTLRSGASSLSDLLNAKGVDQSSLASILQNGLLFDATA